MKEDDKFYRRLAKVIKEERTKQNLTIKELAKRANLSSITISDIENNKSRPYISTLLKINDGLNRIKFSATKNIQFGITP